MNVFQRAYLAGFLDGDGSIILQLRKRDEFRFKFRPKTLVILYQNSKYVDRLHEFKRWIGAGYVYIRNDRISELRIEGHARVKEFLTKTRKYILFKNEQVDYMLEAIRLLSQKRYDVWDFLKVCELGDKISACNYSTSRKYTAEYVKSVLKKQKLIPVTTGSPERYRTEDG